MRGLDHLGIVRTYKTTTVLVQVGAPTSTLWVTESLWPMPIVLVLFGACYPAMPISAKHALKVCSDRHAEAAAGLLLCMRALMAEEAALSAC